MDGSSSQPHTEQPMSPIHSFPTEDMYNAKYSILYSTQPLVMTTHLAPDKVAASPPKSKPTRGRQKRTAQNEDASLSTACTNEEEIELCKEQNKGTRSSNVRYGEWKMEDGVPKHGSLLWSSGDASINMNVDVGNDEEDEVEELRRPMGRDKAKGLKKKGLRSSGSSSSIMTKTFGWGALGDRSLTSMESCTPIEALSSVRYH
ncbi:hypothetical protein Tco_0721842 [Tanacetum coccineum]